MRKKGAFLITLGLLLIAAALCLTAYNIWDADRADKAAQSAVQSLRELIPQNGKAQAAPEEAPTPTGATEAAAQTTPAVQTLPSAQTVLESATETTTQTAPSEKTESAGATEPRAERASSEGTTFGGETTAEAQTTPVVVTPPTGVITPVAEEAPEAQTMPAGVVTREVKIKPGAQTAPDIKKGIPDPLGEREMPTVTLNGYRYIGVLDVKSLELSLPVMEDWDYDRLKVSPCRFAGNVYEDDLVICAHNYPQHFTKLKYAPLGTEIKFTDAEGTEFLYAVSSVETIGPNDVEGMIYGDWDLTLFTCNTSGQTRCAIRCDRIN